MSTNKDYLSIENSKIGKNLSNNAKDLMFLINQNLDAVTKSIEKFQMNVAIAKIYEIVNALSKYKLVSDGDEHALFSIKHID